MNLRRTLATYVQRASRSFPVVLLTGARQVGKTTLLRDLAEDGRTYVTLDDPLALRLALDDPALFLERFVPPCLIDEIQYAPGLLPHIKLAVDRAPRQRKGLFWLTGSQPFHIMRGVTESLAGRAAVIQLLGLSRRETRGAGDDDLPPFLPETAILNRYEASAVPASLRQIYAAIWRGTYPAIVVDRKMDRDLFYGSYVQTYVQRDVRDLARVGDQAAFLRFLRAAAARVGQLLNIADMAREVDIAPNTAKSWLSILETSGLVYLLQPWHNNLTKRLVKTPKLYFLDTGLCAYLTQWSSPETLEAGAMSGAIFENWMIVELLKSYWHRGRPAPFHYFRNKDQREIDLLIESDGRLYPLECKKSAAPSASALQGFDALQNLGHKLGQGAVICLTPRMVPLNRNALAVPASFL